MPELYSYDRMINKEGMQKFNEGDFNSERHLTFPSIQNGSQEVRSPRKDDASCPRRQEVKFIAGPLPSELGRIRSRDSLTLGKDVPVPSIAPSLHNSRWWQISGNTFC